MSDVTAPPDAASMPDPGDELISRVQGSPDRDTFFRTGRQSVGELERALAIVGRSLDSFESVLDFGCGCGRMLLWMEELGRTRKLHGTDIDAEAVAWCQQHLPFASVVVNNADPPLPYPDGAFDLIFNQSVFTHIDERRQDAWLSELQRVTRPGGFVVLTTHGEVALAADGWGIRERLESDGIVFLHSIYPSDYALPAWYQVTYHAPWYVFEHWGRWFEIRAYIPGGVLNHQDHILLERTPTDRPPGRPLGARPPRSSAPPAPHAVSAALGAVFNSRTNAAFAPSRFGLAGRLIRRLALRGMRPYSAHEDTFDRAVIDAINTLESVVDAERTHNQS